jgi:hypothetical protein
VTTPTNGVNGARSENPGFFARWTSRWSKARSEESASAAAREHDDDFATLEEEGKVFSTSASRKHDGTAAERRDKAASGNTSAEPDENLEVAGFESSLWSLGRFDATVGQTKLTAEEAVTYKTELDWARQQLAWKRKHALEKSKVEMLEGDEKRLVGEVEALRIRRWELSSHPLLPPDWRYPLMALVYLVLGVFAFFAEIPLAIGLAKNGLQLEGGREILLEWMTMSTPALVIILCLLSLSFKLVLDTLDSHAPLRVDEAAPGKEAGRDAGQAHARDWRKAHGRWVKGLRIAVFGMCVATMILMAYLRIVTDQVMVLKNTSASVTSAPASPGAGDSALEAVEKERKWAAFWALGLLTVTLPIYAAMCLHAGATRIRQNVRDGQAHRALRLALKELAECREKIATHKADIAALDARMADEKGDANAIKKALLETRLNIYRHGHERGMVRPEEHPPTPSHFDFYRDALKRLSHRRTRTYTVQPSGHARGAGNGVTQ